MAKKTIAEPSIDFDYDIVDPDATDQSWTRYPVAQWYNGQQALKAIGGVQYSGGAVLPAKYLSGGVIPDGWTAGAVTFRSGTDEDVVTTQNIVFAPIRTRFRFFAKQGEEVVYYPRHAFAAGANMRGHLQALCAIQGMEEPIVVTFKGKASQAFEALLKDFDMRVIHSANRTAPKGKRLPRYAFWMSVTPGAHTKVGAPGHESAVTLPTLNLPADITREYLMSCYVGRENLERFQEWYKQADAWAGAWGVSGE